MTKQKLYRAKVFPMAGAKSILFFACPYTGTIKQLGWAIKRLQKDGYEIVAYENPNYVLDGGDPALLIQAVGAIASDVEQRVAEYEGQGIHDFGFFGSSLGSFILYNCVAMVPQLKWGVFNTGGNMAQGVWRFDKVRKSYESQGLRLSQLEDAWVGLQYPDFHNLGGNHYVFFGSHQDKLAPLHDIDEYLEPLTKAGAKVEALPAKSVGHLSVVVRGLLSCRRLVGLVRPGSSD